MAKRVRDAELESRAARSRLKVSGKPYYKSIGPGLHVGYRKGKRAGMWVVRRYAGASTYIVETIAEADDYADADGDKILTFWQAQDEARKIAGKPKRSSGPYKVKDAVADYLIELEGRASYADTKQRLAAYALPALGDKHADKLTADTLRHWHRDLASSGKRIRSVKGGEQRTRPHDVADLESREASKGLRKSNPRAAEGGSESRLPRRPCCGRCRMAEGAAVPQGQPVPLLLSHSETVHANPAGC